MPAASFVSRFTLKFIEVLAAAAATAVSGYVVAHLGDYFPSKANPPPALQAGPSVDGAAGGERAAPVAAVPADGIGPRDADALRLKVQQVAAPPAELPAAVRTNPDATSAAQHKPAAALANATEDKPHNADSLEAQVRAALAKGEADRPAPVNATANATANASTHQAAIPAKAAETQPRPADPAAQNQNLADSPAVEIKSMPVATVDASPPTAPQPQANVQQANVQQANAQADAQTPSLFSAFKHLPDLLRTDTPVPADEAPRPPMPVGQ